MRRPAPGARARAQARKESDRSRSAASIAPRAAAQCSAFTILPVSAPTLTATVGTKVQSDQRVGSVGHLRRCAARAPATKGGYPEHGIPVHTGYRGRNAGVAAWLGRTAHPVPPRRRYTAGAQDDCRRRPTAVCAGAHRVQRGAPRPSVATTANPYTTSNPSFWEVRPLSCARAPLS